MNALELTGLSKSFGGLRVTSDVTTVVAPGERRLIIGPNGAGKTTLFNLITGEITQDAGTLSLFAQDMGTLPMRQRTHLGLARTYQIIKLFPHSTLLHNVMLSALGLSPRRWSPFRPFAGEAGIKSRAMEALERVGLGHLAQRPLSQTSYGEQRRVEISMALVQKPRVLLLDEPFAGLSVDERVEVARLIHDIPRDITIVMIEHDMEVALDFAERITVMHFGRILCEGTRADVIGDPRVQEVYFGT